MELHGGRWWQHLEVRRDEGAPNGGVEEYKVLVGADVQRLRFQCPPKRAPVKALVAMHHVLCVDWKSGQVDVLQQQGCCRPPTASTQQPSARLGFEEGRHCHNFAPLWHLLDSDTGEDANRAR